MMLVLAAWAAAVLFTDPARSRAAPQSRPATGPSDAVLQAVSDELARTMRRLEMGKLGKPYFVSYSVRDSLRVSISASFGGVKDPYAVRHREFTVDLRVGGRGFDNSHYIAKDTWESRPPVAGLVVEDDVGALRSALWLVTDRAYKEALERLSQKAAYKRARNIQEELPDLSTDPVAAAALAAAPSPDPPFDAAAWRGRVRRLSAVFRRYPAVQRSSVELSWDSEATVFADSEGRLGRRPTSSFELGMEAGGQAKDGMRVGDQRRVLRLSPGDMPSEAALEAEARALAEDVSALAAAPPMDQYLGPVLLEGQAAAEFFNQLLARNVSAPRAWWVEEEWAKRHFRAGDLAERIGLRVVSPLLTVEDDPRMRSFNGVPLAGHYELDSEGIPARRVNLVEDGILKDVLMSRAPTKDRALSNGHGRGALNEHPLGRPGVMVVRARLGMTDPELKSELLRRAREFGLAHGFIIRRIGTEDSQEPDDLLAPPVLAYKAYVADGREELVRNAVFMGVTLRALRDVAAASHSSTVYNYPQWGPFRYSRGAVAASLVCPSVIVAELELKKTEKKPEKPPYLPHPYFAR